MPTPFEEELTLTDRYQKTIVPEAVLDQFLDFLARDMARYPECLQAVDAGLLQRLQSRIDGIYVDLDASLSADDE